MDFGNFWQTLWLTFKLAGITTLFLCLLGIPLAYFMAKSRHWSKAILETLVSMPLVLPPTVLGFYLLLLLGPEQGIGYWLGRWFDWQLIFTFEGLVFGSIIYSLPFMVQPVQSGLEKLPKQLWEASYLLGKSEWTTATRVLFPNIKPALITGIVLTFAHTIGEFGVILMIGGNIPGKTRVASIAIYDAVESLHYDQANNYALILCGFAFVVLFVVYRMNRKMEGYGA